MSDAASAWVAPYWRSQAHGGGQYHASIWVLNPSAKQAGVIVHWFDSVGTELANHQLFPSAKQTERSEAPDAPEVSTTFWGWALVRSEGDPPTPVVPWGETVPSSVNLGADALPYFVDMSFYRVDELTHLVKGLGRLPSPPTPPHR
jgi:hypothetical protein